MEESAKEARVLKVEIDPKLLETISKIEGYVKEGKVNTAWVALSKILGYLEKRDINSLSARIKKAEQGLPCGTKISSPGGSGKSGRTAKSGPHAVCLR